MTSRTLRIARYMVRLAASEARIKSLVSKYPTVPESSIRDMATLDPTGDKGSYLEWIVNRVKNGKIAWPEDRGRVQRALAGYHDLKKQPRYLKQYNVSPDINKYTLHDLEAINRRVHGEPDTTPDRGEALPPGATVFSRGDDYRIVKVGGPGTDLDQAITAACTLGEKTDWCTGDKEAARHYLEEGPLYIIYYREDKLAQTDGDQLMDTSDNPIDIRKDPDLWQELSRVGIISKGKFAYEYALRVVKGRYPAGERDLLSDPPNRYKYILNWLNESWPEAEPLICRDGIPKEIYTYVLNCLQHRRWPEGEKALLASRHPDSSMYIVEYAAYIIRGRWPEGERVLLEQEDLDAIFRYISLCMNNQRWPAVEHILLNQTYLGDSWFENRLSYYLAFYAVNFIKHRWRKAEDKIIRDTVALRLYTSSLKLDPKKLMEEFIARHPRTPAHETGDPSRGEVR